MLNKTKGTTMKRPKALAAFKKRMQFFAFGSIFRIRSTGQVLPDFCILAYEDSDQPPHMFIPQPNPAATVPSARMNRPR